MITWIASYPRSGNGWFRTIMEQSFQLTSVDMYYRVPEEQRGRWLAEASQSSVRKFVKTHGLPSVDRDPAIYVLRDGRDCLVSYAWFTLQVGQKLKPQEVTRLHYEQTLKMLILSRDHPFGTWSSNVQAWCTRPNTCLVRYEDMMRAPRDTVAGALRAVGVTALAVAEPPTFEQMHAKDALIARRGQVGSWRDEFPAQLLPLFWDLHGPAMDMLGYGERDRPHCGRPRAAA